MSEQEKRLDGLLTVKTTRPMSTQDRILLSSAAEDIAAKLGVASVVLGPDEDAHLDHGGCLRELATEIRKLVETNQAMLEFLVQNYLQDNEPGGQPPGRYLDDEADSLG